MAGLLGQGWDDPRSMATLQLAAGLLGPGNFGQGLGRGLLGYQASITNDKENTLRDAEAKRMQQALADHQANQAAAQAQAQRMGQFQQSLRPQGSPTAENAAKGPDWAALAMQYPEQIETIKKLSDARNFGRDEVARTVEGTDAQGNKIIRQYGKFGDEQGAGIPGYVAPQLVNQGNKQSFVKPTAGLSLPMGMSPEGAAADARGRASLAQSERHFQIGQAGKADEKWQYDSARGGLVNLQTGEFKPAMQGGVPVGKAGDAKAVTESERTAAFLWNRVRDSKAQLDAAVDGTPTAAKPGIVQSAVRAAAGQTAANIITPEARQRVDSAQMDILDAALTLGTGAAYTKEQLEGYRTSYFPQIGDEPKAVADKKARLDNLLKAAEVKAGRAAQSAPPPFSPGEVEQTATNPQTGEKLVLRNGQWVPVK